MKINNKIETTSTRTGEYFSSREIKEASPEELKVRLYGDAYMGYYYFQRQEDGSVKVVRSDKEVEMVNPTEGYNGQAQKMGKALYTTGWDYKRGRPVIVILDKIALINAILSVAEDDDLGDVSEYDFKFGFDPNAPAQDKYRISRLDRTPIPDDIKQQLDEFIKTVDLENYMKGGEAFVGKNDEDLSVDDIPFD